MAGKSGTHLAFIDESMRTALGGGVYVIAAAIVAEADARHIEADVRTALGRRRHRFHWHGESEKVRLLFMDAIAAHPLAGITMTVPSPIARRQEKAREQALWSLVSHLEADGVQALVIEAREEMLNRRDGRTIGAMKRCGLATSLTYRFEKPSENALLWVADALAGATGAMLAGHGHYLARLGDGRVTRHTVGA